MGRELTDYQKATLQSHKMAIHDIKSEIREYEEKIHDLTEELEYQCGLLQEWAERYNVSLSLEELV